MKLFLISFAAGAGAFTAFAIYCHRYVFRNVEEAICWEPPEKP